MSKDFVKLANFKNGVLHGLSRTFDCGRIIYLETYVEGKREGERKIYYPNGRVLKQTWKDDKWLKNFD